MRKPITIIMLLLLHLAIVAHASTPTLGVVQGQKATRDTIFFDNMEGHANWAYQNIGEYTLIDVDTAVTYSFQNYTFPNAQVRHAYMVFNPSQTSPALTSLVPHSGNKALASFCPKNASPANDWLITKKFTNIQPNTVISFYARSFSSTYGLEKMRVAVSTTTPTVEAFTTVLSGAEPLTVPIAWTKYEYKLGAFAGQDIYIAINHVSVDVHFLLVDDIYVRNEPRYNATVAVKSKTNEVLTGAQVSILEGADTVANGLTDASGNFVAINLFKGTYTVKVTKTGYKNFSESRVMKNADTTWNVAMSGFNANVLVKNMYNVAVSGASVDVLSGSTVVVNGTTGAGGAFVASNLKPGTYTVNVAKAGYQSYSESYTINTADTIWSVPMLGYSTAITVKSIYNTVVEGAKVAVKLGSINVTGLTDASGSFLIDNLMAGTYSVKVTKTGFQNYSESHILKTADTTWTVVMQNIVGVPHLAGDDFNIYPNPTHGSINIEMQGSYEVRVLDVAGRLVAKQVMVDRLQLDMSELQKGVYFVQLAGKDGKQYNSRFVKD